MPWTYPACLVTSRGYFGHSRSCHFSKFWMSGWPVFCILMALQKNYQATQMLPKVIIFCVNCFLHYFAPWHWVPKRCNDLCNKLLLLLCHKAVLNLFVTHSFICLFTFAHPHPDHSVYPAHQSSNALSRQMHFRIFVILPCPLYFQSCHSRSQMWCLREAWVW